MPVPGRSTCRSLTLTATEQPTLCPPIAPNLHPALPRASHVFGPLFVARPRLRRGSGEAPVGL
jgi:hypothetical protein